MELIHLQMRKRAYDLGIPLFKADEWFSILRWMQTMFEDGCISGNTTNNLIKEIWDAVRTCPNPFAVLQESYENMKIEGVTV